MPVEHEPDSSEHPREPVSRDTMVAALLREREGYLRRGLKERVAEVDEQLRIRGHKPPTDGPPAKTETAEQHDTTKPRARRTPGKDRT